MTTLANLRSRVLRLVGDPEGAGYSDDLVLDGIGSALDAILPWLPKTCYSTIVGDGSSLSFSLPSGVYEIESVIVDTTGEVLPMAVISPGQRLSSFTQNTNDWILYPSGSITFSKALNSSETYRLYYTSWWTKPTSSTPLATVLETPDYLETALSYYAAQYILTPTAVGASEIGQFKTRTDSGNPEHNPMQVTVKFLLDLFGREMNKHPKYVKAAK